jgi:class 3 adenylate cyclase
VDLAHVNERFRALLRSHGAEDALFAERNAGLAEGKRILYRVGVNLGDVLVEGDDILGDGVNIAARLEGIAEPGGVCISGSAYEQVRGKIEAEFADLGEKALQQVRQATADVVDVETGDLHRFRQRRALDSDGKEASCRRLRRGPSAEDRACRKPVSNYQVGG